MSGREWKPGQLAMVTIHERSDAQVNRGEVSHIAMRDRVGSWASGTTRERHIDEADVTDVRPIAAIDPEDYGGVDHLRDLIHAQMKRGNHRYPWYDDVAAALREYADPKPPKPAEPQCIAALVRDSDSELWVRHRNGDWACLNSPGRSNDVLKWDALRDKYGPIATVSEGVTS